MTKLIFRYIFQPDHTLLQETASSLADETDDIIANEIINSSGGWQQISNVLLKSTK